MRQQIIMQGVHVMTGNIQRIISMLPAEQMTVAAGPLIIQMTQIAQIQIVRGSVLQSQQIILQIQTWVVQTI